MTTYQDRELHDQTARRDVQDLSPREARFTDVKAWLASLNADVEKNAIADGIVWLSIVSGPATLDLVMGRPTPGGTREAPAYGTRYVNASYVARGQLHTLSAYCGVVAKGAAVNSHAHEVSKETALRLQETARKVQTGLSRFPELEVRSGGSLHLHNVDEGWLADPEQGIEVPAMLTCAGCGEPIYWANQAWRHTDTGRAEVYDKLPGEVLRGVARSKLNHLADPEEAGKKL